MEKLILKNGELVTLVRWLNEIGLPGTESRERTKFLSLCWDQIKKNDEGRIALLEKFATRDRAGKLKYKENAFPKQYDLTEEATEKFKIEHEKILEETFEIDVDGNKAKILAVYKILKETDYKFSQNDAMAYDAWMVAFEKLEL